MRAKALSDGFEDLTSPDLRLTDWAKEVVDKISQQDHGGAVALYAAFRQEVLLPPVQRGLERRGKLLVEFGKRWAPQLEQLCGKDGKGLRTLKASVFMQKVREVANAFKLEMEKRHKKPLEVGDQQWEVSSGE